MLFFPAYILGGTAFAYVSLTGQHRSKAGLYAEQTCQAIPPPYACERSCGPGYIECGSFPDCYNPSLGEICCSDGTFCATGHYCTNVGCCSDSNSLSDCGATVSFSTIPSILSPTKSFSYVFSSSSTKSPSSVSRTTASTIKDTAITTSTTGSPTQPASQQSSSTPSTKTRPISASRSVSSATTSTLAPQTANAGQRLEAGVVSFLLCGLSIIVILL